MRAGSFPSILTAVPPLPYWTQQASGHFARPCSIASVASIRGAATAGAAVGAVVAGLAAATASVGQGAGQSTRQGSPPGQPAQRGREFTGGCAENDGASDTGSVHGRGSTQSGAPARRLSARASLLKTPPSMPPRARLGTPGQQVEAGLSRGSSMQQSLLPPDAGNSSGGRTPRLNK